MCSPDLRKSW